MRKIILFILFTILSQNNALAGGNPLGFVVPYDWADFTDKEKELYVSGVIDGQIFMLYGASSPQLDSFLKCAKTEGIKSIIKHTELQMAFGEDIKSPMPWSISKGVGLACKKHRGK